MYKKTIEKGKERTKIKNMRINEIVLLLLQYLLHTEYIVNIHAI